ncbi:MAG TPA: diacylglycerol kinase family protein [Candidatus Saccharimonadales bacterium]|nr:diacylglycerol kinase family protein [Candidatus Saccharimonadales bacterium]
MDALNRFFQSLYTAFTGVVFVIRVERNARVHLIIALLVFIASVALGISNVELAAVFFAVILVFTAEIVNTALEKTLDLIEPKSSDQVRIIKDMAAGAVLVSALGAAAIGIAIFSPYLIRFIWHQ